MKQRQFYVFKFHTSRLKEYKFDIAITFDEALLSGEVIAIADSQMLRSIRDIRNHHVDFKKIDELYAERDTLKALQTRSRCSFQEGITSLQQKVNDALFISDYVTVVVDHPSHYKYIYNNGLKINEKVYRRFSCSAGQARNSTVVLVNEEIADELRRRLNNGRDMSKPLAASKFNAYFGLASSATQVVSEPRFIVVKDFINQTTFKANFVTETDWDEDDIVDQREATLEMNRSDGMGLISPEQSRKWAQELGLDYVPSQWGIRQSFIKGMLCTFPIHQFCEAVNGGNYLVETIYTDDCGKPVMADLRDYDVIITESQFKLWDSYSSLEEYIQNYRANKLYWGVTQYSPKEPANMLKLNYQFIQTLNLGQSDIEELCAQFVDWLQGVSYDNPWYMMLFLIGTNNTEKKIAEFLRSDEGYWIKSLIVNPSLKNDKFIRSKIRDMLKKRIQAGCMGEIYVDGNFQTLVSDPYALMQHVCGHRVTGLLEAGEAYSNYWIQRGVSLVDAMRAPLTYRSEHVLLNLRNDEKMRKWYRFCETGIIISYHGHEVVNFAGADFDMDSLATTNNPIMIKGVYRDELPVVYTPPKPQKKLLTEEDLYHADIFSFGSIIGSITNKGSNGYALLPNLERDYGADSEEVKLVVSRLQQCCKAQSAQIDRTKIGQDVKGIPGVWINYSKIQDDDDIDTVARKRLLNRTLLSKPPYFFIYRYRDTKQQYDKYVDENQVTCLQRFGISLESLLAMSNKTPDQDEFVNNYYKYMPVTWSDSPMNLLCRYIERVKFEISKKTKSDTRFDYELYKHPDVDYTEEEYEAVIRIISRYIKTVHMEMTGSQSADDEFIMVSARDVLDDELGQIVCNRYVITNILVDYFYKDNPNSKKKILWDIYGKYIFKNVKRNTRGKVYFPFPSETGAIKYMGGRYALKEVEVI